MTRIEFYQSRIDLLLDIIDSFPEFTSVHARVILANLEGRLEAYQLLKKIEGETDQIFEQIEKEVMELLRK